MLLKKLLSKTVLLVFLGVTLFSSSVFADGSFLITPDKSVDGGLGRYQVEVKPGEEMYFDFYISNITNKPLDLTYYPADAKPLTNGGRSFSSKSEKPSLAGSWIIPQGVNKIQMKPKEEIKVTYKVKIPEDIVPGEYVALLGAEEFIQGTPVPQTTSDDKKVFTAIDEESRKGVQMVFQYKKDQAIHQMTIDSLKHEYASNGQSMLFLELSNRGTILERPTGMIVVKDANDKVVFSKNYEADSIYGNTTAIMHYELGTTHLPVGRYSVYYEARYSPDKLVSRTFYFDVTKEQAKWSDENMQLSGLKDKRLGLLDFFKEYPWIAYPVSALLLACLLWILWFFLFYRRKKEEKEEELVVSSNKSFKA